jgi:hypothetical protein
MWLVLTVLLCTPSSSKSLSLKALRTRKRLDLGRLMTTINATDARLSTHEEVCALRYEQINARLKRLEAIMLKTAGVMILSMGGTIFSAVWILK